MQSKAYHVTEKVGAQSTDGKGLCSGSLSLLCVVRLISPKGTMFGVHIPAQWRLLSGLLFHVHTTTQTFILTAMVLSRLVAAATLARKARQIKTKIRSCLYKCDSKEAQISLLIPVRHESLRPMIAKSQPRHKRITHEGRPLIYWKVQCSKGKCHLFRSQRAFYVLTRQCRLRLFTIKRL